jgi:hypothetical protein
MQGKKIDLNVPMFKGKFDSKAFKEWFRPSVDLFQILWIQ